MNLKPEVLAPAGELEQLKIAVLYGADAVYLAAKSFGMRAAPANFSYEQLAEGCKFAHDHGVKVYQTVNVLPTNQEVAELDEFLKQSELAGVDAFIVSDIGVLMLARRICPDVEIHISVQAGVVNYLTANELYKLGAKRVVLSRELTIDEIADIRAHIPEDMEIETFVHGSICMAFSGRCLISKYFVNRDANHGVCAQPCRWEYEIVEPKNPANRLTIVEEHTKTEDGSKISQGSYILNSKDLNLMEHIPQLVKAGVTSLKIEGRAKSSFYVGSVVNSYRRAVDWVFENSGAALPKSLIHEISKVSHRDYTTGFYFASARDKNGNIIEGGYDAEQTPSSYYDKGYKQQWRPLAVKLEDGWHQRGKFSVGDSVEVMVPLCEKSQLDEPFFKTEIKSIQGLSDPNTRKAGQLLAEPVPQNSTPHADQILALEFANIQNTSIPVGSFVRGRI